MKLKNIECYRTEEVTIPRNEKDSYAAYADKYRKYAYNTNADGTFSILKVSVSANSGIFSSFGDTYRLELLWTQSSRYYVLTNAYMSWKKLSTAQLERINKNNPNLGKLVLDAVAKYNDTNLYKDEAKVLDTLREL